VPVQSDNDSETKRATHFDFIPVIPTRSRTVLVSPGSLRYAQLVLRNDSSADITELNAGGIAKPGCNAIAELLATMADDKHRLTVDRIIAIIAREGASARTVDGSERSVKRADDLADHDLGGRLREANTRHVDPSSNAEYIAKLQEDRVEELLRNFVAHGDFRHERRSWQEADFSRLGADQTLDITAEAGLTPAVAI